MFILVVVTLVIYSLGIVLLQAPKSNSKTNIWLAFFLFMGGLGYPVEILCYYIIPVLNNNKIIIVFSQFLSAISFRLSPYFFLLAGMSYSDFFNEGIKKRLRYLLLIPVTLTFIIDLVFPEIGFIKHYIHETKWFWVTAIWAVLYVAFGNIFFFHAYYVEQNQKRKNRKLLVLLITLPLLGNALVAYGTQLFKLSKWRMCIASLIPAGLTILIFFLNLIKKDVLGVRIKIEQVSLKEEKEEILNKVNLTNAERIVLEHLLSGLSTKEIANLEVKAQQTVKNQITSIYHKMGVKDKAELLEILRTEDPPE